MGEYIRGKKAYTKWDAESENIDIEYRPDAHKGQIQETWLSGTKGKIIKFLLLTLLFFIGVIIGFVIRRGVHEVPHHHRSQKSEEMKTYAFTFKHCQALQEEIKGDNIQEFLKNYTSEPHIAGKPSSREYVKHIVQSWKSWNIENVRVEKFKVLLSYPSSDEPNAVRLVLKPNDAIVLAASESGDDELHPDLRPYFAYSPNKSAEGKLVYANYGRKEDFEYLIKENVTLAGSIIIMRLGKLHRANKVKFAEEYNASGVLLYPDPADYVNKMKIYPNGLGLPRDGVVRGSLNLFPGDPQNSFQEETGTHLRSSSQIPGIPVEPISYSNAERFMREMAGPPAPSNWTGGMNITYRLGPGHASDNNHIVKMEIFNQLKEVEIQNVIGNIKGIFEPDRYVIMGSHHDSWTNGTGNPGTGLAVFMEVVRSFGHLKENGWRPSRTLVFACWDAEEFGMIGSTEWLQFHEKELHSRAVAYINTDAAIEGRDILLVRGSPLLQKAVHEAEKYVHFPQHGAKKENVLAFWLASLFGKENKSEVLNSNLSLLGSDSDSGSFMSLYGISSVHLKFVSNDADKGYYLYHSAYDNFDAVQKFIDPDFEISQTLARYLATLGLLLSDSFLLPVKIEDYGTTVLHAYEAFIEEYKVLFEEMSIETEALAAAVSQFAHACKAFHYNFTTVNMDYETLGFHEYNDRALELERAFIQPNLGIYELSYRHALFGPHPYNMKQGIAFPQLVKAILNAQSTNHTASWKRVRHEIFQVINALQSGSMVLSSDILTHTG